MINSKIESFLPAAVYYYSFRFVKVWVTSNPNKEEKEN
jgi:hypothetical protein